MSLWTRTRPASPSGPLLSVGIASARASARFVLRPGREFARIALERFRIDLPAEIVVRVPRDDSARVIELDDLAAHRDALVLGAIPVGVVKERLDPAGLLALAHRSPLFVSIPSCGGSNTDVVDRARPP